MSLLSPFNAFFAVLLGAIVLLYRLRLRRKEKIVASNLLWDAAIRDLQANAPWQKLRSNLLMWLQLALLLLLVLALMRPAIQVFSAGGQTIAVVLDASASMGATDVLPSRFEKARAQASDLINALSDQDAGTVILAGRQTRVLAPLSNDKNSLKRAVAGARNFDTSSDLRPAIVLAASLLRDKKNPQIYVISDGAVTPVGDLSLGKIGLQFVKVGQSGDNLGITALDARRPYAKGADAQIFTTLSNFGPRAQTVNLELSREGNLLEVRPVTVPGATKSGDGALVPGTANELFDDLKFDSGQFSASFENANDALKSDNIAFAQLNAPREINVALTAGNLFLERALSLDASTRVFVGPPLRDREFDVVVIDGNVPPRLPPANQLVFNAQTPLCPIQKIGLVKAPDVADFNRNHPVSRYAPWNDIKFAQSWAVKTLPWGETIVEGDRGPLVVAGEKNGLRVVWCGFDLRDTDLPLRVAYPIFITNALRWLTAPRGQSRGEGAPLRTGEAIPILAPQGTRQIRVRAPDGRQNEVVERNPNEPFLYDGALDVGTYTASAGQWKQSFSVSLLSKSESDIAPRQKLRLNEKQSIGSQNRARSNHELWGILIWVALCVLGVEWWIFHRGL